MCPVTPDGAEQATTVFTCRLRREFRDGCPPRLAVHGPGSLVALVSRTFSITAFARVIIIV